MTFDAQRTELQIHTERLHAFLGPVWAEQLLIALHAIALRQHRPYLSLVVSSTAYVVANSNHFAPDAKPLRIEGCDPRKFIDTSKMTSEEYLRYMQDLSRHAQRLTPKQLFESFIK